MAWKCLSWHIKGYWAILVVIFISFTIGLNLGLHGLLVVVQNDLAYITHKQNAKQHAQDKLSTVISTTQSTQQPTYDPSPATTVILKHESDQDPVAAKVVETKKAEKAAAAPTLESRIEEVNILVDAYALTVFEDVLKRLPSLTTDRSKEDIPIVLLTCNRPALLRKTIESLLNVRGIKKESIVISQDGALQEIADIANEAGLKLIQNQSGLRLRGGAANDGASRIAQHYKFSLTSAFDLHPAATAVVVIEDDLLFSPDLYEYLQFTAPVLQADPTAFVVSAWSDNGFKDKVHEPYALRRTDYFPGLGWLLTRQLYKEELEPKWPASHWDHWLRAPETSKGRDIIYPQVPRTYHNGIKGTFMNLETHNKYFRDIGYNTDPAVTWPPTPAPVPVEGQQQVQLHEKAQEIGHVAFMRGHHLVDQHRIEQMVKRCKHTTAVTDLLQYRGEIVCMWLSVSTNCESSPVAFAPIATFFGIWHEHRRGNHQGVHEFYWEGNYLLLLNVHDEDLRHRVGGRNVGQKRVTFKHLMPPDVKPLRRTDQFDKTLLADFKRRHLKVKTTKAAAPGLSCNAVCSALGQTCKAENLALINTCAALQDAYACTACQASFGAEQPAYVDPRAEAQFSPGQCLFNTGSAPSSCEASHPSTYRLCPCG